MMTGEASSRRGAGATGQGVPQYVQAGVFAGPDRRDSAVPCERRGKSRTLVAVVKGSRPTRRASVCLLAFHPLVLSEFERLLRNTRRGRPAAALEPDLIADPAKLNVPKASVYVLESHAHRPTTEALVVGVLGRQPGARVVVVAETFDQAAAFPLLRLGRQGAAHVRRSRRSSSRGRSRRSRAAASGCRGRCSRSSSTRRSPRCGVPAGRPGRRGSHAGEGSARRAAREPLQQGDRRASSTCPSGPRSSTSRISSRSTASAGAPT